MPRDGRAPVMAGDHRRLFPECIHEADHVADQMKERVLIDLVGAVAFAVAAHVRCDDVKSGVTERRQLVAPRVPALGETVTENDERTRTLLGDSQANPVRLDHPVLNLAHRYLLSVQTSRPSRVA